MANQLYTPREVSPSLGKTISANIAQTFSIRIIGSQCVAYKIQIYKTSDGTTYYDSGKKVLTITLYDGEILSQDVTLDPNDYYWRMVLYWDSTNYITSQYYHFVASTDPVVTFSPTIPTSISMPSLSVTGHYYQAEGIGVKYYNISLYDINDNLLDSSGDIYSQNIKWIFYGLLSNNSYHIQITGVTQGDIQFASEKSTFIVHYIVPSALRKPDVTVFDDSSVLIDWNNVSYIRGVATGTVSYVSDFLYAGNTALHLSAGANVVFTFDYNAPFTATTLWKPDSTGFTGQIFKVHNITESNAIIFGYNGSAFYIDDNGVVQYEPHTLTSSIYRLAIIYDGYSFKLYWKVVA